MYIYIYWNHMKLKLLAYTTCTLNTLFSHVFSTRSGAFPDKSSPIAGAPRGSIPKTKLPIGAQVEPRKTCRTDESFYSISHHFDSFSWIKKKKNYSRNSWKFVNWNFQGRPTTSKSAILFDRWPTVRYQRNNVSQTMPSQRKNCTINSRIC